MITFSQARYLLFKYASELRQASGILSINLPEALNFYNALPIKSDRDYPPFKRSTMDGYAARFLEKNHEFEANDIISFEVVGTSEAANPYKGRVADMQAVRIFTGAKVPRGANYLVQSELIQSNGKKIQVSWQNFKSAKNFVAKGAEIKKNKITVKIGEKLDPAKISLAQAFGINRMHVYPKPEIAILSTGDELVPAGSSPTDYQIRDINSIYLQTALTNDGYRTKILGLANDSYSSLGKFINQQILRYKVIIITGGAAGSAKDKNVSMLKNFGATELFYQVEIKPAKQVWFGKMAESIFFVLSGNPLACSLAFKLYVLPFLNILSGGSTDKAWPWINFRLINDLENDTKIDRLYPFKFHDPNNTSDIQPVKFLSSGDFTIANRTDGFFYVQSQKKKLTALTIVPCMLW